MARLSRTVAMPVAQAQASDHTLAQELAHDVGQQLLALRQNWRPSGFHRSFGSPLAYEGDMLAHNQLLQDLTETQRDDAVLSEEGQDDPSRLAAERLWVVDPLDGSADFAYGNSEWAVHVGLAIAGVAVAGAVSLPALDLVFATGQHAPPKPAKSAADQPIKIVTARSRVHYEGALLANELDAEVFACGSAGVKAMLVVRGSADAYVHASGIYEWDVCAPAAVAEAAGLHVSDIYGEPLRFNQPDPVVAGFVACRSELAEPIFGVLQNHLSQGR